MFILGWLSGTVILLLLSVLVLFSVTSKSTFVPSPVKSLVNFCTSFGAVYLRFGLLDNSNCLFLVLEG